jgi:uncharacterized protein YjbI with pentapeptide repeats
MPVLRTTRNKDRNGPDGRLRPRGKGAATVMVVKGFFRKCRQFARIRRHQPRPPEWRPVHRPEADLPGADFVGQNLSRAVFRGANLANANFAGANMEGADLGGANLRNANFTEAILIEADLTRSDMRGANLVAADLTGARVSDADLTGAYMWGADLSGADVSGANLKAARTGGAYLAEAMNLDLDQFRATIHDETGAYRLTPRKNEDSRGQEGDRAR